MKQETRGSVGGVLPGHLRWAFEPALAGFFLLAWTLSALSRGGYTEFAAIFLLTAAIAVSRLSPGGALVGVALALLLQAGGLLPGVVVATWAHPLAVMAVAFAAAAFGGPVVRWIGFATALVASILTAAVTVAPAFLSVRPDAGGWELVISAVRIIATYSVTGSVISALLLGAWALGLALSLRAAAPDIRRSPVEEWLARNDVGSPVSGRTLAGDHAVDRLTTEGADDHSSLLRSITGTQFVIDVVIAVAFGVLGVVAGIVDGGALAVLAIFTIAVVFRRVSPLLALGIAWLGAGIQLALSLSVVVSDIAILLVLYATAAFGGRFTRWAGLASAGVGALVAATYLVVIGSGPLPIDVMQRPEFLTSTATNFLTLLVASAGVLGLAWTLGFLVRTWRRARQSRAQAARAMEEQRAAQRDVVVEQERNRIARDMHDVVAHSLAVVIAQADGARYARATDPTAVDGALTTIASTAREALGDVRILLAQLRKDEAQGPQPVLADLDRLREQMRSAGLDIRWTESGTPLPLGTGAQLAVYRIVQEAFTNALRHGKPDTAVHASLHWDDTGVLATVENEVRADEADDQPAGVGHGLPGMRERALLAGGTLTVETPPGRFRVVARIPATGPTATGTTAAADATEGAQA